MPPLSNHATITEYQIDIKTLRSFDAHLIDPTDSSTPQKPNVRIEMVSPDKNTTIINGLTPYTMYEVTVSALNIHGSSLPSIANRLYFKCVSVVMIRFFF